MDLTEISFRRYLPIVLLVVSFVALFLFGVSYLIEIQIIIEKPQYGNITKTAQTLWRATLGVTTVGSFLIGIYALLRGENSSNGLPTKVEIKGTGHDIDVYPSGPIREEDDERNGEEVDNSGSKEDTPSTTSDESCESNNTKEKSAN